MLKLIKDLSSPLLSFIILTIAASFMATFLGVRTKHITGDEWLIGSMMSSTYAGMVVGAFKLGTLLNRIGHIRMFAVFASLMGSVSLLHGIFFSPLSWLLLRFIAGLSLAGLYMVIEGWLLASSNTKNRTRILSIYMISLYMSQALGQLFLKLPDLTNLVPFLVITLMCSLSVVPVALTRAKTPESTEAALLKISKLYELSPSGVIGCFLSGMIMGSVYGLIPSYVSDIGRYSELSSIMMCIILGAALLQYPIGWVSDQIDKRQVLIALNIIVVFSSICIMLLEKSSSTAYYIVMFLFGGAAFSLYTLNISHACDYVEPKDMMAAVGGLLLAYGVGATVGPLAAPIFSTFLGAEGIFVFFLTIATFMIRFYFYRATKRPSKPVEEQTQYAPVVQTTLVAHELSPIVQEAEKTIQKEERAKERAEEKRKEEQASHQ